MLRGTKGFLALLAVFSLLSGCCHKDDIKPTPVAKPLPHPGCAADACPDLGTCDVVDPASLVAFTCRAFVEGKTCGYGMDQAIRRFVKAGQPSTLGVDAINYYVEHYFACYAPTDESCLPIAASVRVSVPSCKRGPPKVPSITD